MILHFSKNIKLYGWANRHPDGQVVEFMKL